MKNILILTKDQLLGKGMSSDQKKKRDFVLLIFFMIQGFLISNILNHPDYPLPFPTKDSIFPTMIVVVTTMHLLIYKVTSNFIKNKIFRIAYALLLVFQVVMGGFAARQGVDVNEVMTSASLAYFLQFFTHGIVFIVIVKDMLAKRHDINYSLLAATCAFLMIPIIFGFLFAFFSIHNPALINADISNLQEVLSRSFEISHYLAAGMDSPNYSDSNFIKNFGVLESFIVNLYIIFVVGRLMVSDKN